MTLGPHTPLGRIVSLALAIVVSVCGCTLRALAAGDDQSPTVRSVVASCCQKHACPDRAEDPEPAESGGCDCVHAAPTLDSGHGTTLDRLALPPVTMTTAWEDVATHDDRLRFARIAGDRSSPDDDPPDRSARALRSNVIIQV